jgi:hypothetical protein
MPEVTDTPPEIAEMVRARLMARSGAERFRMSVEMFEAARRMVLASFPSGLTETARKRRLFDRLYGHAAANPRMKETLPALRVGFAIEEIFNLTRRSTVGT